MGQSELRDLLARHDLRQLAQRVTARYHLAPLSTSPRPASTCATASRWPGGEGKVGFTSEALGAVHRFSGGVPRLVNLICDRVLLAGYVKGARTITPEMVAQAAEEVVGATPGTGLPLAPRPHRHRAHRGPGRCSPSRWPRASRGRPRDPARPRAPSRLRPTPRPARRPRPPPRSARLDELRCRPLPRRGVPSPPPPRRVRRRLGHGTGSLAHDAAHAPRPAARALDLPAVLEMFHPSRRDTCFVALLRLDERAAVRGRVGRRARRSTVPVSQIDALWTRDAVLVWPEPARRCARRASGRRLGAAARSRRSGYTESGPRGRADAASSGTRGLVPDGLLGPRTRMALFAHVARGAARASAAGGGTP